MKTIFAIFMLIMLTACVPTTSRYFEFEHETIDMEFGEPIANLYGEWKFVGKISLVQRYGNPYHIDISFRTTQLNRSPRAVKNIQILTVNEELLYTFEGGDMTTRIISNYDGWFSSYNMPYTYRDLILEHIPLIVKFDLVFKVNGDDVTHTITQKLIPTYKQEKSNLLLDAIMSV